MIPAPDNDAGKDSLTLQTQKAGVQRVLDAELLGPEEYTDASAGKDQGFRQSSGKSSGESGDSGVRFYRVSGGFRHDGAFSRTWSVGNGNGNSCLVPCITFALFLVCVSQFGLLAGIGFAVFYFAGWVAGGIRSMRLLVEGHQPNPWHWRLGNWFISFMLTMWLAGGFN